MVYTSFTCCTFKIMGSVESNAGTEPGSTLYTVGNEYQIHFGGMSLAQLDNCLIQKIDCAKTHCKSKTAPVFILTTLQSLMF